MSEASAPPPPNQQRPTSLTDIISDMVGAQKKSATGNLSTQGTLEYFRPLTEDLSGVLVDAISATTPSSVLSESLVDVLVDALIVPAGNPVTAFELDWVIGDAKAQFVLDGGYPTGGELDV